MSDHIPFDLQIEIIKRVPTKSILKFRAVSKPWKSLIDSAKFIADYNHQSQNLIISYGYYRRDYAYGYGEHFFPTYVKIVDDDTFPQHKITLTVPSYNFNVNMLRVISCSHGLFCLIGHDPGTHVCRAIIWNPSIRKSVQIVVPNLHRLAFFGFGVCRHTNDPKFVKVNKTGTDKCSYEVEVFTLSSGLWRRTLSKLPNKFFQRVWDYPLVIDGFIYWFSLYNGVYMIISFDLTSEEFNQVHLPDKVAFTNDTYLHAPMYKLRESLVVVKSQIKAHKQVYTAWMMDDSVSKSFTKIFTINLPYSIFKNRRILGFRKNGELLMEEKDDKQRVTFVAYEPGSKYIKRLGIYGDSGLCFAGTYEESLLLLDQS